MYLLWKPDPRQPEYVPGWDFCYAVAASTVQDAIEAVERKAAEGCFRQPPTHLSYGPRKTLYVWKSGFLAGCHLQEEHKYGYVLQKVELLQGEPDLFWKPCFPINSKSFEDALLESERRILSGEFNKEPECSVYGPRRAHYCWYARGAPLSDFCLTELFDGSMVFDPNLPGHGVFFLRRTKYPVAEEEESWISGYSTDGFLLRSGVSLEGAVAEAELRALCGDFATRPPHLFIGGRWLCHSWDEGPLAGFHIFCLSYKGSVYPVD
jgi:hypothetical protein